MIIIGSLYAFKLIESRVSLLKFKNVSVDGDGSGLHWDRRTHCHQQIKEPKDLVRNTTN